MTGESYHPRRRDSADLVDVLTDRLAGREFADLPEPRVTARMMAVDLVLAARAGDFDRMRELMLLIERVAAGLEAPESAADRKPVHRAEDSEDWATTRVRRSRPKK